MLKYNINERIILICENYLSHELLNSQCQLVPSDLTDPGALLQQLATGGTAHMYFVAGAAMLHFIPRIDLGSSKIISTVQIYNYILSIT